jgi:hypothetical protein
MIQRLPPRPCLVKGDAGGAGLHVDAHAILEHGDLVAQEIGRGGEAGGAQMGIQQRVQQPFCVGRRRIDQDIQASGGTRHAMENGRDAADDQVPDVMGVKGREHVP